MQFAQPYWLMAGLIACLALAAGFFRSAKKRRAALSRFAASRLLDKLTQSVSPAKRNAKRVLIILAVALVFMALARPQAGYDAREVKRKGIDILLALDTSKSMLAADVAPNRLQRSKLGILDFVEKTGGGRVGLIAFAGSAFLQCPLTLDHEAFAQTLSALDTSVIPLGGTSIASAIRTAREAFAKGASHKFLVVVTDGEDLEGEALDAAREAAKDKVTICAVGVGTPSGELIPVAGKNGVEFVKDPNGQLVKSRLDEDTLQKIALATGGIYAPLGRRAEGLETVYRQKLSLAPKKEFADRLRRVPVERFEWPLLAAIILLGIEFALNDRRPRKKAAIITKSVVAALFLILPGLAHASPQSAQKAYISGDFAKAATDYRAASEKSPQDAVLKFNLGAASYKAGRFDEAARALEESLATEKLGLQNQAYYNLGNTLYRRGQKTEKSGPQDTIVQWEKALDSFQAALKLNPKDADARFNHDFVKKRLEELKKKTPPEKENKEDQKNRKDQKNQQCQNQAGKGKEDKSGKEESGENRANPGKPGQMSREQATNLLDSLKQDEQGMPVYTTQTPPQQDDNRRDW